MLLTAEELYKCTLLTEDECLQIEKDRKTRDEDLWQDSDLITVRKASVRQHKKSMDWFIEEIEGKCLSWENEKAVIIIGDWQAIKDKARA